MDNPEKLAT